MILDHFRRSQSIKPLAGKLYRFAFICFQFEQRPVIKFNYRSLV